MRFTLTTLVSLCLGQAVAWGDTGHRTVAYLAEKYLTDETAAWVHDLLANEHGWDISDAATWADKIKHARHETAQWHYIDAQDDPPRTCDLQYSRDCGSSCIVSALVNQTSILVENTADSQTLTEALMYTIHFLGDIHQPLHCENLDRGGNEISVCFDHRCSHVNLHSIWDTNMIHKLLGITRSPKHNEDREAAANWAKALFQSNNGSDASSTTPDSTTSHLGLSDSSAGLDPKSVAECTDVTDPEHCAVQWAAESNAYVCSVVLEPGIAWLEKNDLAGVYYQRSLPVIQGQILKAGVRLGAWLNAVTAQRHSASKSSSPAQSSSSSMLSSSSSQSPSATASAASLPLAIRGFDAQQPLQIPQQ